MNYKEVELILNGKNRKKYANNTYLVKNQDNIALQYHSTDVVKFYPNGDIQLNNGGWYTSTTKERINWMINPAYNLTQDKGVWYINGKRFANDMMIKCGVGIIGDAKDNPKADAKLKKQVKQYALKCAEAIPLDKPSGGDCWYCYMVTENNQSLGDATKDNSHIDSHIKENYIVPSLVFHALKEAGNTDFILSLVFNNPDKHMIDVAKQRVYKSVYRYILRLKGYAI